ncbi:peptide chain release factor N(5)-glutamine methyltransferase [bacterium]|nr:peptide chain release factor N(5)-glutamine methyltransferase [bacterium]
MNTTNQNTTGLPNIEKTVWLLIDVLKKATSFLEIRDIESARLNAERLLAHALNVTRVDLYLRYDQPLEPAERENYKSLLHRRANGEPLQYILGETEFMSLAFSVNPAVLIPRPETESLVELVIRRYAGRGPVRMLDIGTGSGAIAVSLAHYCPQAEIFAVDVSTEALTMAEHNADANSVAQRIHWIHGDLFSPEFVQVLDGSFDVIISNPPYVSLNEWDGLPVEIRSHEPRLALCDEGDGLAAYRRLARISSDLLSDSGCIYVEVGDTQAATVMRYFKEAGLVDLKIHPDLNGIGRIVEGRGAGGYRNFE